jgi:AbrB family looped-hinge helix DNA binding protein
MHHQIIRKEVRKMVQSGSKASCCTSGNTAGGCCRVEALISVDERGQMVLPKELRERANIKAGDKLAMISWEKDGEVCCLTLIKADNLAEQVRGFLGPIMSDIGGMEK